MLTLIALSAALMQQTPPSAPPAPPEIRTRFMMLGGDGPGALDKDGDGQVSRDEFAAPMNDHFARMDKDSDGRLSTEELTAGHGAMAGGHDVMIMRGPGGHAGAGVHRFEMRRPHAGGEARTMVFTGGPGGHGAHVITPHGEGAPGERIEIRRMGGPGGEHDTDADNDGRISEAEFTGPLRDAFTRMDSDRSGFIEQSERGHGHDAQVFVHRIETRQNDED